ncbi:hypothetical protein BH23PLA1_BH23PLA1_19760 [soil metagenome]
MATSDETPPVPSKSGLTTAKGVKAGVFLKVPATGNPNQKRPNLLYVTGENLNEINQGNKDQRVKVCAGNDRLTILNVQSFANGRILQLRVQARKMGDCPTLTSVPAQPQGKGVGPAPRDLCDLTITIDDEDLLPVEPVIDDPDPSAVQP